MTDAVMPTTDYSLMGGVPPKQEGMKVSLPQNNSATPVTGWDPSPEEVKVNAEAKEKHDAEHGPVIKALMQGTSPNATPEQRKVVADHLNNANFNVPTADKTQWGELINAFAKGDWAGVNNAWNGGNDKYLEGFDAVKNKYWKVYNQRGELRRIEDANYKPLSPEQEAQVGGITTKGDMSPAQTAMYKALQANYSNVAAVQSDLFNKTLKTANVAATEAPAIIDATNRLKEITPQLYKASVDPATRAFVSGIQTIGTGNTKGIESAVEIMKSAENGNKASSEIDNSTARDIGAQLGLHYIEKKGWLDQNGNVVTANDIDRRANNLKRNESSEEKINARKEDLANKAQILFAKDPKTLDLINQYIDAQSQIGISKSKLEDAGGIPGIKPSLPHAVMDSFSAGDIKNIHDEAYAKIASAWVQFVQDKKATLAPGQTPDTTQWLLEFNKNPEIANLKKEAAQKAVEITNKVPTTPTVNGPVVPGLVSSSTAKSLGTPTVEVAAPEPNAPSRTPTITKATSSTDKKAKLKSILGAE